MYGSRKAVMVWVCALLFGLTVGMAHAEDGSTDMDLRDQAVTETLVADLAGDLSVETDSPEAAVEPECPSESVLAALGMESALSVTGMLSGWTCGPCSISACANKPVGTRCGFNLYCVVTTVCSTQPWTDRCVCGTDHA